MVGLVLVLLGVAVLPACTITPALGDSIAVNGSEPQNPLVPSNTNENGGGRIVDRLFAGLRRIDADGGLHNEVARSIETTDQQHYVIRLEPGWTFSDGSPVTAHSFVDAWNYGALITNAQLQSYAYAPIVGFDDVQADPPRAQSMSGLRVLDELTFTVDLKAPTIDFRTRLASAPFYPLPEVAFKDMAAFGQHPIGNGPYRFADGNAWQHDVKLDLVPNESYRGGRPPKNKGLTFVFYSEFDAAYSDLLAGNLDVLDTVPSSALTVVDDDLGDRIVRAPTAQNQWIGTQPGLPHFDGEEGRLRRHAISRAIDRAAIAEKIFRGTREPARDYTSRVLPGYDPELPGSEVLEYNPDEARRLWAKANEIAPWSGKFEIAYNADGDHQAWIDAVAHSIKNTLGIEAVGAAYPTFKQLRDQITSGTIGKAFRSGWQGDYPSMLQFLEPSFLGGSATNDFAYRNPDFDALIATAEAAPTEAESWRLVGRAQSVLLHDLPTIPIFDYVNTAGYSERVHNVTFAWNGMADFENIELR
ncbi:ABC transporter substrate-binding protein [Nocardia donostiensis]|uniref:ABC transporter substrate-binding protein n=1 Tax=Nocardia donostiensis TaxID=1538463 RepID=A0A1V2TDA6_9NOCA|nr:ABC transporter substrate-binding protein [Nocardia donostiensis]OQS14439.1 ABC transporter substrate-binding protein [Nocardia donostiensis]OQS24327.1 ABC transporter substrate-binding protein [Nocardia donostiensis]